jgi:pimeloyl-ACP methyl ester carboxylesterase
VVAPFLRGYAPSDLAPDGSYQVGALVRDVEQLCAALGGDGRTLLVGHDWGAITAYATGALHPGLAQRIVTLAVPPLPALERAVSLRRGPSALVALAGQVRRSWYALAQQLPVVSEAAFEPLVERLWRDWSPGYDAAEDLAHLRAAVPDRAHRTAVLRYYRAALQPWYRRAEYRTEQAAMRAVPSVPVLYLHGENDGCIGVDLGAGAAAVLPPGSSRVVVPDAGHFVQVEQPEVVADEILAFVS